MKCIGLHKIVLGDYYKFCQKLIQCILSLLLVIYASGLRLHTYHLHETYAAFCAQGFYYCMLHDNSNECSEHFDCCEHDHSHGMLVHCNITPVFTNTDNGFTGYRGFQTPDLASSLIAETSMSRVSSFTITLHPRSGPGRPCPITGQQLPLLI